MDAISTIKDTPEFASLCSYIQLFGNDLNVSLSHSQLENYLEINDHESTPKQWIDLHRKLLSRLNVKCARDKWESSINKFINGTLASETLLPELYDKGYYSISAQHRARLLNIIFDCQFDKNAKFKEKVNQRPNKDLRVQPFGSDIYGCLYWFFVDSEVNIIMYKENLEDESFKIIAQSIEDLGNLLNELQNIDVDNVDLSKLYIESVTPDETNSPNNELDILKDEVIDKCELNSPPATVKVEEIHSCIEMNGNKSPEIESKDALINKVKESESLTVKIESKIDENSDNESKLVISTVERQENAQELPIPVEEVDSLYKTETTSDLRVDEKKKRGRKPKFTKTTIKPPESETKFKDIVSEPTEVDIQESNMNLRRSERKRKPVNPFTIMYTPISSKKSKIIDSQNDTTDLAESESNKKVKSKVKDKDHSKRGRPKKNKKHSNKDKEAKAEKKLKKKSKHQIKVHKKHKQRKPWEDADSSEEHVEEEEEEDMYQREESDASVNIKDEEDIWNDKPESDFDPDNLSVQSDEETLKSRGRNYFRQKSRLIKTEKAEVVDDKPCQICLGGNLPEMILLCDDCDYGHHAMCLRPSLMLIPEGDWYCPKCQHKKLIVNLTERISELDKLLAKNVAKIRMQERLNFVNISMTNMLTGTRSSKPLVKSNGEDSNSDNDSSSPSLSSSSETDNSSDGSSSSDSEKGTHGRYKFRESSRKENTRYNFEEIDKIFDNALENDEKYQFEKNRQENGESEESEPEYDYSGIEPRKKSSGKDMSNILEEEKPRLRRPAKRKRLMYGSDDGDFEDDDKDQDFKLSEESGSEVDEDDFRVSDNDVSDSDEQWAVRTRRSTRKSQCRKEKKGKKRRRVEYEDVASRPRRSAARKVNYLEMLGEDEDDDVDDDGNGDQQQSQHSPNFDSSDDNDSSKPPPVLARKKSKLLNRRRKISDSEYEESKENSVSESDSTEELDNAKKLKKRKLCLDSDTDSGRDDNDGDGKLRIDDRKEEDIVDKELCNEDTKKDAVVEKIEVEDEKKEGETEECDLRNKEEEKEVCDRGNKIGEGAKESFDIENKMVEEEKEESDTERKLVAEVRMRNEECVLPSLSLKNPMRAKDDQDIDVENEVESETEEEDDGSSLDGPLEVHESGDLSVNNCLTD